MSHLTGHLLIYFLIMMNVFSTESITDKPFFFFLDSLLDKEE